MAVAPAAAVTPVATAVAAATMNLYSYVVPSAQNPIYNIVREEREADEKCDVEI